MNILKQWLYMYRFGGFFTPAIGSAMSVAGPIIGGLMGGSGSSQSGSTTSTNTSVPWDAQQPYLTDIFNNSQNWYKNGGTRIAPFNNQQQQSFDLTAGNVNNPALGAASNNVQNFANGNYLNSNPYLSGMVNSADNSIVRNYQNAVAPGISSNFEANGRYGSGAMANSQSQSNQDLATQLGNTNSQIYGNAYQSGLNNMLQASALAPGVNSSNLANINALNSVGGQQQTQQQNINNQPLSSLQSYLNLVGGNQYGGTSTSTNPYFTNTMGNTLGGMMAGNSIANSLSNSGALNSISNLFNGSSPTNSMMASMGYPV